METVKHYVLFLVLIPALNPGFSQVLHTENFNVIMDTTKMIKGSFTPSFRYRNLKEDYFEIANTTDISLRFNKHAITAANRLEYARFGKDNLMSGGFVYLEYRLIQDKKLAFEPYFQMHWQEIRGLDRKYAGGAYVRWRILVRPSIGIYAGLGGLYEFERWNYTGVSDSLLIPEDPVPVEVSRLRGASYFSFKKTFNEVFNLDVSLYFQPYISGSWQNYRLAGSFELTYNISEFLGLTVLYQNIYDPRPLVPIDALFNDINLGLTFSF
ncbi:MAG: hypothetical protein RLO17_17550 [Cyclobacteriaceae bacterium]